MKRMSEHNEQYAYNLQIRYELKKLLHVRVNI